MLKDIFDCETKPKPMQENWLRIMALMPELKGQLGGEVNEHDIQLSADAKEIMIEHNIAQNTHLPA